MRVRNRPVLGTFYALALLISIVTLVTELIMNVFTGSPGQGWMLGLDLVLFWLPIGCLTAGVTGWTRSKHRKRRLDAAKRSLSSPEAQLRAVNSMETIQPLTPVPLPKAPGREVNFGLQAGEED